MRRRRASAGSALASARPSVVAYAMLLTWSREDAEARADEALVVAFARGGGGGPAAIEERARRGVVARFLRDARRGSLDAPDPRTASAPGTGFSDLDPVDRLCVVLQAFDGLDAPEIANRLGIELEEARRRLRDAMESLGASFIPDTDQVRIVPYTKTGSRR